MVFNTPQALLHAFPVGKREVIPISSVFYGNKLPAAEPDWGPAVTKWLLCASWTPSTLASDMKLITPERSLAIGSNWPLAASDDKAEFGPHDLLIRKQSLVTSILKAEMLRKRYLSGSVVLRI
jgi:hypothetical protein